MQKTFSFNREFDFVRMDGLRRATGRPPHEWDIYSIKELLDNALDADEILWQRDHTHTPDIRIHIEYIPVPEMKSQQLFIEVSNRALFPVKQMQEIFDTGWYTSRKAFIKGLTRGALGNALKTLLGIPYALRNHAAGDWQPMLKPMSIRCEEWEYLPQYKVDALMQQVKVNIDSQQMRRVQGTVIRIGIDNFQQELPRTLEDIATLVQQYHLCNPHAALSWSVTMHDQVWTEKYLPDPRWCNKFSGVAPVQWYSLTAFQDVLTALHRQQNQGKEEGQISLESIYNSFLSPQQREELGCIEDGHLVSSDITGKAGIQLYHKLFQRSSCSNATQLGAIGVSHIQAALEKTLELDSQLLYQNRTSNTPDMPFTLEVSAAYTKTGKRQLWTAINFAPTYDDPFQNRYLAAPILPGEPVLGLRGLLDVYGLTEDTPVVVFLHLVCPNIEHHEFSKTSINHLPFKEDLGIALDSVLTELRQQQEAEELHLEETIHQEIAALLGEVKPEERFILHQLFAQVRARLQKHRVYEQWLERADAPARLQNYILSYLNAHASLTQSIAQPTVSTLTIPLHPDRHFLLSTEHISQEVFAKHHCNKILYMQERDLEAVATENNWLCQMDMALLHNPQDPQRLRDIIIQCLLKCDLPLMIWHNADETGTNLVRQIQAWINEENLNSQRLIDLGLYTTSSSQHASMMAMMPREQVLWLRQRFSELAIPPKTLPDEQSLRQDISKRLEQLLLSHLMNHLSREVADIYGTFDQALDITSTLIQQQLDRKIKQLLQQEDCHDSYEAILEQVVHGFFKEIRHDHQVTFQQCMSRIHVTQR